MKEFGETKKLKNLGGKINSLCLGFLFLWLAYVSIPNEFSSWWQFSIMFSISFFFIIFGYKEFYFDENQIIIFFPLSPLWKSRIVKVENVTKINFRAYDGGGNAWEYLGVRYSKFPFYTEIHLPKDLMEIKTFFEMMAVNGECKVIGKDDQNRFIIEHLKGLNLKHKLKFS